MVWLASETSSEFVVHVAMLRVDLGEWDEFKVGAWSVVETLVGELILSFVSEANSNIVVVVSLDALHSTPESELLKILFRWFVEQVIQTQFELEFFFNIETEAVVSEVDKASVKIQDVHN